MMTDGLLGFLGAVIGAALTVAGAAFVQHRSERTKRKQEVRFNIYQRLLELNHHYFWVASAAIHNEIPSREILDACFKASWQIADELRKFDDIEHVKEIAEVLFSINVPNANERANRISSLIDKYGALVNPALSDAMAQISVQNVMALGSDKDPKSYAPGSVNFHP